MYIRQRHSFSLIVLLVLGLLLLCAAPVAAGLALDNDNARTTPCYRGEVNSYRGPAPARRIA